MSAALDVALEPQARPQDTRPPETAAERGEYLTQLALEAERRTHAEYNDLRSSEPMATMLAKHMRDRLGHAAQVWTVEVDELREMLSDAHGEIAELRARRAQLEETLAKAGDDLTELEVRLDEERQRACAAAQRHAVEMGEMRSALLHLCAQLAREIRRGGGA